MTATLEQTHVRNCTCTPCARYRERKQYRLEHDRGVRRMTSADRARRHLLWLAENGAGRRTVAAALGISDLTLVLIGNGRRTQIRVSTERQILAFQPGDQDLVPNCRTVDATATRLRVEALIALGYTKGFVARSIGRNSDDLDLNERVQRRRALAVLELCVQIGDTPGPSRKAAVQARNKGWRVPAEYDDEFYDPHWDGITTEDAVAAAEAITRGEAHLREYDFLRDYDLGDAQIAERLGVTTDYLQVLLRKRRRECMDTVRDLS